jgi:hypothetical protein
MKFSVQVIVHPADDTEASPVVREVFTFDRDDLAPGTLGLQLAEAKDLLAAVQDSVVEQQASAAITKQVACPHCGRARRHKDTRTIVVRGHPGYGSNLPPGNSAPGARFKAVTGAASGGDRSRTQSPNRRMVWVM